MMELNTFLDTKKSLVTVYKSAKAIRLSSKTAQELNIIMYNYL